MKWTAVIPLKGGERKTRLAAHFSAEQRRELTHCMFDHVRSVLQACPEIAVLGVLAEAPPCGWTGPHFDDQRRGLNVELAAVAMLIGARPMLVVHADLPLLDRTDICVLLAQASRTGCAIAPDRADVGTNAVALVDPSGYAFQFGPGSKARHLRQRQTRLVRRLGLAHDIDMLDDLQEAWRITSGAFTW